MKQTKPFFFIIFIYLISLTSFSQTNENKLSLDESSIDDQFEYILKKSGNFKGPKGQAYEAVKRSLFLTLKAHTLDSLRMVHQKLSKTQTIVNTQAKTIKDLQTNLSNTQTYLNKTSEEKNSIVLFGMPMRKVNYSILMWSIIAGLLTLLILFIYKFKNSNTITKKAKDTLAELEEEFDDHRKKALEREQKVRRQLQDEINKQKKV